MARRSLGKFTGAGNSGNFHIAEMTMYDISGKTLLLSQPNV
jgi:hypothetical protein